MPGLVLLHGFTHTGASWQPVIAKLGEGYSPLAFDIRGHGSASDVEPVTLDAVIADLARLAPERFTLVGYSMGGRIALHAALALPQRVRRLILVSASPGLADPVERATRLEADERLAQEIERSEIDDFAERWARTPVLAGMSQAAQAVAQADRRRCSPDGLARALRGLGTGALPSVWDRLAELRMPVVLVSGERDAKFTDIARAMAPAISDGVVEIVPSVGHAVHLEAPDRVAAIIAAE